MCCMDYQYGIYRMETSLKISTFVHHGIYHSVNFFVTFFSIFLFTRASLILHLEKGFTGVPHHEHHHHQHHHPHHPHHHRCIIMRIIWIDWSKEKSGEGSKYTAVAAVAPLVLRHLFLFYHLLNPRHTLHPHHHTPPHTPPHTSTPPHTPPPPHHHHFIIFSPSSPLQHWQSQSP